MNIPPGSDPTTHEHTLFLESFYVFEGEVEIRTGKQIFVATSGLWLRFPKNKSIYGFKSK